MKFSEYWLCKWFSVHIDHNSLLKNFSAAGLEVTSIEKVSKYFKNVIIGKITKCIKHPKNSKLYINTVDIGLPTTLNIVCSNKNCRVNLKVAVATLESTFPNAYKTHTMNIKHYISEGTLCSAYTLGISLYDSKKIIEFPKNAPIGADVYKYLKLYDNIISINVTTNRTDCSSIFGIARDLSLVSGYKLKKPIFNKIFPVTQEKLLISVKSPKFCPRYIGRVIKNINVNVTTPIWIAEKLRRSGFISQGIIKDLSNYILLELGQPIFAYDLKKIEKKIIVREAKSNEIFFLSHNKTISLTSGTLVIASDTNILSIAGIIHSMYSHITIDTKDIFLECAFFDPEKILNCSHDYNLYTETSQYYGNGNVDPFFSFSVFERFTALLLKICGGEPGPVINITCKKFLPVLKNIILYKKKITRLVGNFVTKKEIENILLRVGCKLISTKFFWNVYIPTWRSDLSIEEDLIEEIFRVYGYDNIPGIPIDFPIKPSVSTTTILPLQRIKVLLSDRGYQEVITYSFVNPKIQKLIFPMKQALNIINPMSQDMSVMRLSLLTGLINVATYNKNRQQNRIRIFESGLCYIPDGNACFGVRQDFMLSGIVIGSRFNEHWDIPNREIDFYDVKGDLESIFYLTYNDSNIVFKNSTNNFILHPQKSSDIYYQGKSIGFVGVIHPVLKKKLNFTNVSIVLFELFYKYFYKYNIPYFNNITKFPVNRRDISIIIKNEISVKDVINLCKNTLYNKIVDINIFDIYKGKGIQNGYKSLSISIIFQCNTKTLQDEEISNMVNKCLTALKNKFKISLRNT
ncbi:MAG: phenylalanine--tRNA ligase subunit beta [Candidatus Westeberhardia cardiocondylae]|nr:phenylalanine--tRNA ligase subunit beta [Candidatus Westeberhardia cardiocondylae]